MQITDLPHWQRQKRVVFAAVIYLPCFALVTFGGAVPVGALSALLSLSAVVLVLLAPALVLAGSIEAFFQRTLNVSKHTSRMFG